VSTEFVTFDERSELGQRYLDEAEAFWPAYMEFIYHDPVCEAFWPRLNDDFPSFQFIVYDDTEDQFLAQGNTIPFAWTGRDEDLPDGVPTVLSVAFSQAAEGAQPTSLCALLAGVQPRVKSKGLSAELLKYMMGIARRLGFSSLLAPVRPSIKERYPLTPIERYVQWRRPDGLMFDPWLRTHERLGARFAGIASKGNVFRGTVAEWERWTGLTFPESGEYVVRGAITPVTVDRDRDEGVLTEPNVWMVHTVDDVDADDRASP
jgi:GNAT superfamily N-acetyltransferase